MEEAKAAVQAGDLTHARELLTTYFKTNPKNPDAWLWMSAAVTNDKERLVCLKQALALDPKNKAAVIGLRLMGEEIGAPLPLQPVDRVVQKRPPLLKILRAKYKELTQDPRKKSRVNAIVGLAVFAVILIVVWIVSRPAPDPSGNEVLHFSTPLATATGTPVATPTYLGQAPLWTKLKSTFTPTPMFVATPHSRMEAYTAAMRAYDEKNWPKVVDYLTQVLSAEPNAPDVLYHLGDAYRFMNQYPEAEATYNKAISVDASFAPAYLGLGRVYLDRTPADLNQAQLSLEKAVTLNPSLYESYYELARIALLNDDPNLALNWLDRLDSLIPESALGDYYRAKAYLKLNNTPLALTTIQKANQLDLTLLPAYLLWGQILQTNGDYQGSLEPALTYLKYAPSDTEGLLVLAYDYQHLEKYDQAVAALKTVIAGHPDNIEALNMRGDIYLKQQDYTQALNDFESAMKIDPNSFAANLGRGKALLANNSAGSAYMQFVRTEGTAVTDKQKAELVYWRALANLALEELTPAIHDFETFLAYPPELVSPELRADAETRYRSLITPVPTTTP